MTAKNASLPFDEDLNPQIGDAVADTPEPEVAIVDAPDGGDDDVQFPNLDDGEARDHNYTAEFRPAAPVPGEFLLSVGELGEWAYHFRRFSPLRASHGSALALSAAEPLHLRPIVVLEQDGKFVVADGRYILEAVKARHPGDDSVMVRVVRFAGDEGEAVAAMCDNALGTVVATRMEMAHGLLALQRANGISQNALAERYAALNKDKVSNMLIAARLQDAYPVFYELLEEPHKAPISLGVALNKAIKLLPPGDFADLIERATLLVEEGERCGPAGLFELLDLPGQHGQPAASNVPNTEGPQEDGEAIFGEDDQPVGSAQADADGGERLALPPAAAVGEMSLSEREAAAEAFIVHIRRHFGVDDGPG